MCAIRAAPALAAGGEGLLAHESGRPCALHDPRRRVGHEVASEFEGKEAGGRGGARCSTARRAQGQGRAWSVRACCRQQRRVFSDTVSRSVVADALALVLDADSIAEASTAASIFIDSDVEAGPGQEGGVKPATKAAALTEMQAADTPRRGRGRTEPASDMCDCAAAAITPETGCEAPGQDAGHELHGAASDASGKWCSRSTAAWVASEEG